MQKDVLEQELGDCRCGNCELQIKAGGVGVCPGACLRAALACGSVQAAIAGSVGQVGPELPHSPIQEGCDLRAQVLEHVVPKKVLDDGPAGRAATGEGQIIVAVHNGTIAGGKLARHATELIARIKGTVEGARLVARQQVRAGVGPQEDAVHKIVDEVAVGAEELDLHLLGGVPKGGVEAGEGGLHALHELGVVGGLLVLLCGAEQLGNGHLRWRGGGPHRGIVRAVSGIAPAGVHHAALHGALERAALLRRAVEA